MSSLALRIAVKGRAATARVVPLACREAVRAHLGFDDVEPIRAVGLMRVPMQPLAFLSAIVNCVAWTKEELCCVPVAL